MPFNFFTPSDPAALTCHSNFKVADREKTMADNEEIGFELGDRVLLLGGQIDKLEGRIYYIDENLIRILPEGVSDRLVDVPIIEGDIDPSLEIEHFYQLSKRTNPAFVSQINANVGQIAQTFSAAGDLGAVYTIKAINEKDDSIVLADDTENDFEINFDFKGIPLDLPFAVLRPRELPVEDNYNIEAEANTNTEQEAVPTEADLFEDLLDSEMAKLAETAVGKIQEIDASERVYPDMDQRNDMIQDMIAALPVASQKNPEQQQRIRKLVEQCMSLRNSLVEYSKTGDPVGQIPTSYLTLSDLIKNKDIPLSRPVIESKRILFLDHTAASILSMADNNPSQDAIEVAGADVIIKYLDDTVKARNNFTKTQLGGISAEQVSEGLPAWFQSFETINNVYDKTWAPMSRNGNTRFKADKEFFQAPIPDLDTPLIDGVRAKMDDKTILTADYVGKIHLSMLRGLGPRKTRLRERDPLLQVEAAEDGSVSNTLLFPLSEQRNLGATRSGRIANDIAYSQIRPESMHDILERLEGIPDVATAGRILSVGEGGNTLGNIQLSDWLLAQPLYPLGLADAATGLSNYGFSDVELNSDQQDSIVTKIDKFRALIKQHLIELRDASTAELSKQKMQNNSFLIGEALTEFMAILEGQPILASKIQEVRNKLPPYKNNDVAIIASILEKSSDLFLTTMAQVAAPLARERRRMEHDRFLEALNQALAKNLKDENAGYEPDRNNCPHVLDYNDIHKVRDDSQRMKLFAKFVTKYRGKREDNWVNCSACGLHLVCYHEILLLQEFLHPREKDTIHKELILTFGGEQFHGRFTCKNCGQVLAELEYDTSIEFTDDGVPMSGRSVLELNDKVENDILDQLLGPSAAGEDAIEFKTDTQTTTYRAALKIFDTIGITAKEDAYKRIVQRVESEILKQPSLEDYKKITKGKRAMDYDVYINRILVASTAVNCVIEIQVDIPGYVMRFKLPGCRAGFSGYPLGNEKDRTCIEYIACAVASIQENSAPWNMTGYMRDSNEKKRQEAILVDMNRLLTPLLTNTMVQQQISMKRAQLQDLYGSVIYSEQLPEFIPAGFHPHPHKPSDEPIVVPEAAGQIERIRAWILQANKIGKDNGNYVKGTPYSDATCCLMPIQKPGSFLKAGDLVELPLKSPPVGPVKSHLGIHFVPRPAERLEGVVSPEIIYRIFLKVCYKGANMGLPHQPGYTNQCIYCDFIFPESPYTPRIFPPIKSATTNSKEFQKDIETYFKDVESVIRNGKIALETQGISITKQTFDEVLDASHMAYKVAPYVKKVPIAGMNLFDMLRRISPEPFEGWQQMLTLTMEGLSKLTPGADDIEIAEAYGQISNFAAGIITEFEGRVGATNARVLQKVLESGPNEMIETVRTYFLIPFQRLICNFNTSSLLDFNKLAPKTNDDVNRATAVHLEYLKVLEKRATGSTLDKLKWARGRLADALVILKKYIRGPTIPGGSLGISYITTALIGGILSDFIDPNSVPPGMGEVSAAVNSGARAPIQIIDVCIQKISKEGLKFTEEQIREMIARRDQLEKNTFVKKYDKLTPEEKATAKRIKAIGAKEWAVGGTKAVYAYDPEQYERERVQRLEMGFQDATRGGDIYIDGVPAGEYREEGGYDNAQMAEDDY